MHTVESLRYLAEQFISKSNRILEYSKNRDATGLQREKIVESFVRKIAPDSFAVVSGFIYDKENPSKQLDIIVYDKSNYSPLFDEGGYAIVIPESVILVIEVKSFLNKEQIQLGMNNLMSATRLNSNIQSSIFGFDGLSMEKVREHLGTYLVDNNLNSEDIKYFPEAFVNLDNYVYLSIKRNDAIIYMASKDLSFQEQFLTYYSMLSYKLYDYRRKLHLEGRLPRLEEIGFPVQFSFGDTRELKFGNSDTLKRMGT